MSRVQGDIAEKIRRYGKGRDSINNMVIPPVLQPVIDVKNKIEYQYIRQNTITDVTANGVYALTTRLEDKDYEVLFLSVELFTGTFEVDDILITDDDGNDCYFDSQNAGVTNKCKINNSSVCPLYVPAGQWLEAVVSNKTVNGTMLVNGLYRFFDAQMEAPT